jgi:hypothetical protein
MKMAVCWVVALWMEAVRTCETLVSFYQTTVALQPRRRPCPQEPATGLYFGPDDFDSYFHFLLFKIHFNIILSSTSGFFKWFLQVFRLKLCMEFPLSRVLHAPHISFILILSQ